MTKHGTKIGPLKHRVILFSKTVIGFTKIEVSIRSFASGNTLKISGFDKIRWKSDRLEWSLVIVKREPILHSFTLDEPWSQIKKKHTTKFSNTTSSG